MSPRRARRLPDAIPRRTRGGSISPAGGSEDRRASDRDGGASGPERNESWPDGDWVIRLVPGSASAKSYRCPGCDQEIPPGTPHLVAWPAELPGPSERRHWHRTCWEQRMRRRPGRRVGI
jgi:hypothetical protein